MGDMMLTGPDVQTLPCTSGCNAMSNVSPTRRLEHVLAFPGPGKGLPPGQSLLPQLSSKPDSQAPSTASC